MRKAFSIFILVFLSGCSLLEPTTPDEQPSTMTLSMTASSQVNPNVYSENTLAIQIDELQDTSIEKAEITSDKIPEKKIALNNSDDMNNNDYGSQIQIMSESALIEGKTITRLICEKEPEKVRLAEDTPISEETIKQKTVAIDKASAEATPIAFKLIQMKDDSLFLQADFDGLFSDMEATLGTTYLTHDDFMLVPGEFKFIEPVEVEDETRYVAVIAAYNDYTNKQWKGAVKIKSKGKEYALFLYFGEKQVLIKKQEL